MAHNPKILDDFVDALNKSSTPSPASAISTAATAVPLKAKSSISILQELCQKASKGLEVPKYEEVPGETRGFRYRVKVLDCSFEDTLFYSRKQDAKESVARLALASDDLSSVHDMSSSFTTPVSSTLGTPTTRGINPTKLDQLLAKRATCRPTVILYEYAQMAYLAMPEFVLSNNSKGLYMCKLHVGGRTFDAPDPQYHLNVIKDMVSEMALDALIYPTESSSATVALATPATNAFPPPILDKKFISLLIEYCQRRRWPPPEYTFEGPPIKIGYVCDVKIIAGEGGVKVFTGNRRFPKKGDAKEDTARIAFEKIVEIG